MAARCVCLRCRSSSVVGLLSVSAAIAAPAAPPKTPAPAPARRLPAPEHVDADTQRDVKTRMGQRGTTMESLVRAVIVLDRPTIRVLATRIADEEVVARTARDKQRSSLPTQFFAQQDELAIFARQLAAAAHDGGDDKVLAEHFSAVMRTCVGCHSTYLHDGPAPGRPNRRERAAQRARRPPVSCQAAASSRRRTVLSAAGFVRLGSFR